MHVAPRATADAGRLALRKKWPSVFEEFMRISAPPIAIYSDSQMTDLSYGPSLSR